MSEPTLKHRRIPSYKIFHLVMDTVSSVPEKVFLLDGELARFTHDMRPSLQIMNMCGPVSQIKDKIYEMFKNVLGGQSEDAGHEFTLDLNLEPEEKAAIYLILLNEDKPEGRSYCIAAYTVADSFFHSKPFDNKTMHYLMIRLLGDICPKIVLLYDQKM